MRIRARVAREIAHLPRAIARYWSPSNTNRRAHEYKEIEYFLDRVRLFDLYRHHKNEEWVTMAHVTPGDLLHVPADTCYRLVLDEGTMLRLRLCGYPRYVCTILSLRGSNSDLASDLFCFSRHLRRTLDAFSFSLIPV